MIQSAIFLKNEEDDVCSSTLPASGPVTGLTLSLSLSKTINCGKFGSVVTVYWVGERKMVKNSWLISDG